MLRLRSLIGRVVNTIKAPFHHLSFFFISHTIHNGIERIVTLLKGKKGGKEGQRLYPSSKKKIVHTRAHREIN